ncbi:hypothetical protein [Paucidesulfovibrio longus]|uniref:hypothetical protein n=1 Tax=Paucidesulfovibrio longus TaxID=889 RepID=UPI0012DF0381|nr:hypothetical protein [Paucidesulfovibrio longus]
MAKTWKGIDGAHYFRFPAGIGKQPLPNPTTATIRPALVDFPIARNCFLRKAPPDIFRPLRNDFPAALPPASACTTAAQ